MAYSWSVHFFRIRNVIWRLSSSYQAWSFGACQGGLTLNTGIVKVSESLTDGDVLGCGIRLKRIHYDETTVTLPKLRKREQKLPLRKKKLKETSKKNGWQDVTKNFLTWLFGWNFTVRSPYFQVFLLNTSTAFVHDCSLETEIEAVYKQFSVPVPVTPVGEVAYFVHVPFNQQSALPRHDCLHGVSPHC